MSAPVSFAWAPQPGPQADAIAATWCTEMLYGGAVFGGKSDFLLGDYLQDVPTYGDAWPGILFRKTMPELEDLISRSKEIYPQTGAEWAEQKKTWTWPNGARLKMRYAERDDDVYRYQGHAYCVAVGTLVAMADGGWKPIERVQVGDYVATLCGPRRVKHTIAPYSTACVAACVTVGSREVVEQIQPETHFFLNAAGGWSSFSKEDQNAGRASSLCNQGIRLPLRHCVPVMLHEQTLRSEIAPLGRPREAANQYPDHGIHPSLASLVHPYTGAALYRSEGVIEGKMEAVPCGQRLVADITVDEVNHYITRGGIVNKNCWIGWDEAGQWASMFPYRYLRSRLRCAKRDVPTKRIRATANPGGAGHHWLKAYFIEKHPMGMEPFVDEETGHEVMFVPSRLRDNKIGLRHDPGYERRIDGMGSPELVRALKLGDWDIIAGAFFPEFSTARHVIAPRSLPAYWQRFRSFDWGSAKPFSVGWWAVSDGELPEFPRGALIRYREWYGMVPGKPNVGLKMTAEQVADGIREREASDVRRDGDVMSGVADPAIFAEDGGPSIGSRMSARGVFFNRADNKRVPQAGAMGGWDQVRARLIGENDTPMIFFFNTCVDLIRTLPALQHDKDRVEDVDSSNEDHAPDECRYACMSRPWVATRPLELVPRDKYRTGQVKSKQRGSVWAA